MSRRTRLSRVLITLDWRDKSLRCASAGTPRAALFYPKNRTSVSVKRLPHNRNQVLAGAPTLRNPTQAHLPRSRPSPVRTGGDIGPVLATLPPRSPARERTSGHLDAPGFYAEHIVEAGAGVHVERDHAQLTLELPVTVLPQTGGAFIAPSASTTAPS